MNMVILESSEDTHDVIMQMIRESYPEYADADITIDSDIYTKDGRTINVHVQPRVAIHHVDINVKVGPEETTGKLCKDKKVLLG